MVLEGSGDAPVTTMVTLLQVLWETGLVTLDQMNRVSTGWGRGAAPAPTPTTPMWLQGFQRVYAALADLSLDAPLAHARLERLLELCCQRGVVTRALRDACPARYGTGTGGHGGTRGETGHRQVWDTGTWRRGTLPGTGGGRGGRGVPPALGHGAGHRTRPARLCGTGGHRGAAGYGTRGSAITPLPGAGSVSSARATGAA